MIKLCVAWACAARARLHGVGSGTFVLKACLLLPGADSFLRSRARCVFASDLGMEAERYRD